MRILALCLLLLAALLLWSGAGLPVHAAADEPPAVTSTAVGGNYQLTGIAWETGVAAQGGNYTLLGPETPTLTGSGCCCGNLPCLLR